MIRDYSIAWRVRGRLINASNTDGLILAGLKLGYGPAWTVHPIYSRNVITYGCRISSININNGDGWDPDSSEDCVIFDTVFDTGDDCIAIKSGKNPEGNIVNRPSKNIWVFDCRTISGHSGIGIGSEMSGGVENVFVWDCDFADAWFGAHIKSTPERGGFVKNIRVQDSKLSCIVVWTVEYNTDGEKAPTLPELSNYSFENIVIKGIKHDEPYHIRIKGFDGGKYSAKNILLKNVHCLNVDKKTALNIVNCDNLVMENVTFEK
jgi:polygalacturonase